MVLLVMQIASSYKFFLTIQTWTYKILQVLQSYKSCKLLQVVQEDILMCKLLPSWQTLTHVLTEITQSLQGLASFHKSQGLASLHKVLQVLTRSCKLQILCLVLTGITFIVTNCAVLKDPFSRFRSKRLFRLV